MHGTRHLVSVFLNILLHYILIWVAFRLVPGIWRCVDSLWVFRTISATLHVWKPLPPSTAWERAMSWWQG